MEKGNFRLTSCQSLETDCHTITLSSCLGNIVYRENGDFVKRVGLQAGQVIL